MKYDDEITVEITCAFEELESLLNKYKFNVKQEYDINDIYMINADCKEKDYKKILNNCLLIRNIITDTRNKKYITYKYKEYNDKDEIIKQGKADCEVESIDNAKSLLEQINYKKLIEIKDYLIIYANDEDEFAIQLVNNKHIYLEIEKECEFSNKKYKDIESMKNVISKYEIPIKNKNYFVKKAEVEMEEVLE